MGNKQSFADRARAAHKELRKTQQQTSISDIQIALNQYKEWCQRIDWMGIIQELSTLPNEKPCRIIYFDDFAHDMDLTELKKYSHNPQFVSQAHMYVKTTCWFTYGIRCHYEPGSTIVYLY